MTKDGASVRCEDIEQHPAVVAWRELDPKHSRPTSVEVFKHEHRTSSVYRLHGLGPAGTAVIAKRKSGEGPDLERQLYAETFPERSLPSLVVYGSASGSGSAWLFLEDAGDVWYSPQLHEHRVLATKWLADLHSAGGYDLPWLPRRGCDHYLTVLREARRGVREGLGHAALTRNGKRTLCAVLSILDVAEGRWPQIEAASNGLPSTLVHGDLHPRNTRIRVRAGRAEFIAFDWEWAGYAPPALDTAMLLDEARSSLAYREQMRDIWPDLSEFDMVRLGRLGEFFRLLDCVRWETRSFRYEWIEKAMENMTVYERCLREIVDRKLDLVLSELGR